MKRKETGYGMDKDKRIKLKNQLPYMLPMIEHFSLTILLHLQNLPTNFLNRPFVLGIVNLFELPESPSMMSNIVRQGSW